MAKHCGTYTFNRSTQKAEYVDLCEFKAKVMGKADGLLPGVLPWLEDSSWPASPYTS